MDDPTLTIPTRPEDALTGSQFANSIVDMPANDLRELAIFKQFELGNVPDFMRKLCPVQASMVTISGSRHKCSYWVTPDYLCIGSNSDYLRVPMSPLTAMKIADLFDGCLITRRMANAVFAAATVKLLAKTKEYGDQMQSVPYFRDHNSTIQTQLESSGAELGELVAGHKKDVVLCKALFDGKPYPAGHSDRVAIYGWAQRIDKGYWTVWQGLNPESHINTYKDYSHGVRLVANKMFLDDELTSVQEVLTMSPLSGLLSDEGVLPSARYPNT